MNVRIYYDCLVIPFFLLFTTHVLARPLRLPLPQLVTTKNPSLTIVATRLPFANKAQNAAIEIVLSRTLKLSQDHDVNLVIVTHLYHDLFLGLGGWVAK